MDTQKKRKIPAKYVYIAVPLMLVALVYLWHQRTIGIKRACSQQAESTAHQLYVSQLEKYPLANEKELKLAKEEGIYLRPVYEFEYDKCLELKGL